jgi:GTPase SAR1 family protein
MKLDAIKTVFVCGPVSSGKTHLICSLLEDKPDVLIVDTTFEFEDDDYQHIWRNPQELITVLESPGHHRIVYHPGKNLHNSFKYCSEAYWLLDHPRWLVLDECHEYADHENFDSLMRYSRKRKLGVICASQRIADVPKSLTANARIIVIFYSAEARDYIAVKDRWGIEIADHMRSLRPLIYNDETEQVEQTPEALVYRKGKPIEIHDLETGNIRIVGNPSSQNSANIAED